MREHLIFERRSILFQGGHREMRNYQRALQFLSRGGSCEGLIALVIARMTDDRDYLLEQGKNPNIGAPNPPAQEELYASLVSDIRNSFEGWQGVARAILTITVFVANDQYQATTWLRKIPDICFPMDEPQPDQNYPRQNLKSLGCFLGILKSIEWLDQNGLEIVEADVIFDLLAPFLLWKESLLIDLENRDFSSKKEIDAYKAEISQIVTNIADVGHLVRFLRLMHQVTLLGKADYESNSFRLNFLEEFNYSVFKSMKSPIDRTKIVLSAV